MNNATPSPSAENPAEKAAVKPAENVHTPGTEELLACPAGLIGDLATVARRSLRSMIRDKEAVIPPLIIGAFFYVVNVGSLAKLTQGATAVTDYKAFQLPPAVIFGVTGLSRAGALVTDINNGYFDRLLATPVRRITLLLGLMMADFALAFALTLPIIGVAMAFGVRFATGIVGILVFALLCGLWGLAFTGFSYAIALKTANPAAVNSAFLIFFPFAFLTTTAVPKSAMSSWLQKIVALNPVTYLLDGLRSIITDGWTTTIFGTIAAIAAVFAIGFTLSFRALQGRVNKR
jgi:ABC-2 type transport system permease protein